MVDEVLSGALELATLGTDLKHVTVDYMDVQGRPIRARLTTQPYDVHAPIVGTARLPVVSLEVEEMPKRRRGPTWGQGLYYRKYGEAEKDMASPLELSKMAARMGLSEATLRHYYFRDPPNGRYRSEGLGWGAPAGCRKLGE